ncbi:hypothetical protein N7510_001603 [Penicillium lagena]|uniref:uncharacterized protein n=1 Tax=Penicillium lagena TaxID=94218 RepID=UPI002541FB80|nr:uncharacterized protein N7510_001603 [Penicillium lagena]KAJ5625294.1 hypothetical protein N7510_001603 [Penicillium lagena]
MASSSGSASGMPRTIRDLVAGFQIKNTESPSKNVPEMDGTPEDQIDMHRMGKIQEFKLTTASAQLSPTCGPELFGLFFKPLGNSFSSRLHREDNITGYRSLRLPAIRGFLVIRQVRFLYLAFSETLLRHFLI